MYFLFAICDHQRVQNYANIERSIFYHSTKSFVENVTLRRAGNGSSPVGIAFLHSKSIAPQTFTHLKASAAGTGGKQSSCVIKGMPTGTSVGQCTKVSVVQTRQACSRQTCDVPPRTALRRRLRLNQPTLQTPNRIRQRVQSRAACRFVMHAKHSLHDRPAQKRNEDACIRRHCSPH